MPRQRLRLQASSVARGVGRLLVVALGLALVWYGAMLVLLALKVSPGTVDGLCGYRTAYDYLASLDAQDISGTDRIVIAAAGVVAALVFGTLLWRALPRPRLTRTAVTLAGGDHGVTEVQPRALERAAEAAALEHPAVVSARGRYDAGTLVVDVTANDARRIVETLRAVQARATESLARHELPVSSVAVTLANYERRNQREIA